MRLPLFCIPLVFIACEDDTKYCTEIGCSSGLTLTIQDSYGGTADTVSGTVTIDGQEYAFDCTDPNSSVFCNNGLVRIQVEQGETASYDLTMGEEFASGELQLNFESYAPNGEDCDPICYVDEHTIQLERPIVPSSH